MLKTRTQFLGVLGRRVEALSCADWHRIQDLTRVVRWCSHCCVRGSRPDGRCVWFATPVQRIGGSSYLFWDRSVLEVFVNDGESTVTRIVYVDDLSDLMACIRVEGGSATIDTLQSWELMPVWDEDEPATVAKL